MITDGTDPIPARTPGKSSTKWIILILGVLAVTATVIIVLATRSGSEDGSHVEYPLGGAANNCGTGGMINGDGGRTLIMDTPGEDLGSGEVPLEDAFCALGYLHVPDAVLEHMQSTRALDGMQTASWDRYEARWTYHPDSGFDITITDNGGNE